MKKTVFEIRKWTQNLNKIIPLLHKTITSSKPNEGEGRKAGK